MSAIRPITRLPSFVSDDEYALITTSTPSSFSDLPAVIKHKEDNVTINLDPPLPDFSGDELKGSLYVLTSALVFFSASERGFQVDYPSITLHAISRGESGPSIYCQLDKSSEEHSASGEEEYSEMWELNIIPASPDSLERIFEALSYCASLHPDDNMEDEDGSDGVFIDPDTTAFETFTGGEGEELSEVGRAALDYLESIIYNPYQGTQETHVNGSGESENSRDVGNKESEETGS